MQPLWIRFKSKAVRFPLRFTHDYRSFGLKLYFLTRIGDVIHYPAGLGWSNGAICERLSQASLVSVIPRYREWDRQTDTLQKVIKLLTVGNDIQAVSNFLRRRDLKLTRISVLRVNTKGEGQRFQTKDLTEDPYIDSLLEK